MKTKFTVIVALVALVLSTGLVAVPISAAGDAPAGFCKGGVAWVVRGQKSLVDPKCNGIYVLDLENKQSRFGTFVEAERARKGRDSTYWFETQVGIVATMTLATAMVPVVTGQLAMNWQNFCQGASPLIFTGGGVLNVGLDQLSPPCSGTFRVVEPWRIGCREPVESNSHCNKGRYWDFDSWAEAVKWLKDYNWPEGSVWFIPSSWSTVSATPVSTNTVTWTPTPKSTATSTPKAPTATPTQTPVPSVPPVGNALPGLTTKVIPPIGWVGIILAMLIVTAGAFLLALFLRRRRRRPAQEPAQE